MFVDSQLAFLTMLTIALTILVAYLLVCVRSLQRDVRTLLGRGNERTRARRSASAGAPGYSQGTPGQAPVVAPGYPQGAAGSAPAAAQARQQGTPAAPGRTAPMPSTPPAQRRVHPAAPYVGPAARSMSPYDAAPATRAQAAQARGPVPPPPPHADTRHATTAPAPDATAAAKPRASLENILGTRVLGILAALMVFAGLVFLAILVLPAITDQMRCAAMFVISAALTAGGIAFCEKRRTPFSLALLGCGLGSVFASLLITYVYFGYLHEASMCVLMLVWLAAGIAAAMRYRSSALAVVTQVGMTVSTCFAYAKGLETSQLPLVIVYQLAAGVLVVLGCRRGVRGGRMASMFASLMVCVFVSQLVAAMHAMSPWRVDDVSLLATMGVQFAVASAIAALVTLDCCRPAEGEGAPPTIRPYGTALLVLCEVLWATLLALDVVAAIMLASPFSLHDSNVLLAAGVALAFVAARWAFAVVLGRRGCLHARLSFVSCVFCAMEAALVLAWRMEAMDFGPALPLLVLVAVAVWATGHATGDARHRMAALAFLCADALLMCGSGFEALCELTGLPVAPLYVALLDVLMFLWWKYLAPQTRDRAKGALLVLGTIGTEVCLGFAWHATDLPYAIASLGAWTCVLVIVAATAFLHPAKRLGLAHSSRTALFANGVAVLALACLAVVSEGPVRYAPNTPGAAALVVGVSLMCAGIIVYRVAEMVAHPEACTKGQQVTSGILVTLWTASAAAGILPANSGALVSVAAMLTALLCTGLGFARSLPSIRLYGLVTALLCVLKIVLVDMGSQNSLGRVVAFIAGGIICFAMSALYTVAVRRMADKG